MIGWSHNTSLAPLSSADREHGVMNLFAATRRDFLMRALLAGAAAPLVAGRPTPALAATNIVAGSFPGVWQDGLKAGPIACYKAKNGGDVSLVFGTPSDFVQKIMATRERPALDVVIGTDADIFQNAQLG